MVQLFKNSYKVGRSGNILFVCGGNGDATMRSRFRDYCAAELPEYDIFLPEFAMEDYFSGDVAEPFDIAVFEEIVGDISHAIVIFPEGPGSFAETGYFAATDDLAKKSVLVLDADLPEQDSFISMGPAKIISEKSRFNPYMSISYTKPQFQRIGERIGRHQIAKYKKALSLTEFAALSRFEVLGLVHKLCDVLSIATIDDILFIFRSIFSSQISAGTVRKITSILVGSKFLLRHGEYGHLCANTQKSSFLVSRDGFRGSESELKLELAALYEEHDAEFAALVEASRDAG